MTADLLQNTKLLSLGKPHQKGRLTMPLPQEGPLSVKVCIMPGIQASCLKQTNLHGFSPAAAVY